jgi:GntR family transcriptional regulator, arabinose operon transcriptional repressor
MSTGIGRKSMQAEVLAKRKKHEELTETLRELAAGLEPGERFPSQSELMRAYRVSDRTVLRSLDDLRRAGWIVRKHGSGTFVTRPELVPMRPRVSASTTIGALALTRTPSRFYQQCLDLLSELTAERGWSLVCQHAPHEGSYAAELPLEGLHPRGFVLMNYRLHDTAVRLMRRGHRVVMLGGPPAGVYPDVPCVHGDHTRGAYAATHHLIELGHRRIAFARADADPALHRSLRWEGHQRALAQAERAGRPVAGSQIRPDLLDVWKADPETAASFFRRPDSPTGVVVWNDTEALELLALLNAAGLRVPEDVSVVGYDALPEGETSWPALTTVDQHLDSQLTAVADLLSRPTAAPPGYSVVVVPDLVRRASCAPPPR